MRTQLRLLIAVKLLFWALEVLPKKHKAKVSLAMYLKTNLMNDYE